MDKRCNKLPLFLSNPILHHSTNPLLHGVILCSSSSS
jgi:hypothetical protein